MMRALLPIALLLAPGVASAQQLLDRAGAPLYIAGEAPSACVLSRPVSTGAVNATLRAVDDGAAEIAIGQLVDPTTGVVQAASVNLAFPLVCNGPHQVTFTPQRGGLTLEGPATPAPGFRTVLPYQLQADWDGANANAQSNAGPLNINSSDGGAGTMSLQIQVPGGGDPPIAGAYSDAIVVEIRSAT